jgi:heterotetrameric sarcosine oxidase beta subunit
MAGMRIPIESHVLQAFVTEGLKPVIDTVITYGMGHFYISQSDKGGLVFGGDLDFYASYAARGNLPMAEHVVEAGLTLMPMIGKAKMLRSWGGIMDMSPDGSPIIDKTHIEGLYLNCGWCYGGFKAVPGSGNCFAHLIATDRPHEAATRYRLDRFATGRGLMDEESTGSQHNLH